MYAFVLCQKQVLSDVQNDKMSLILAIFHYMKMVLEYELMVAKMAYRSVLLI